MPFIQSDKLQGAININIQHYLERIGCNSILEPDLSELSRLQQQHMLTVPFENLNIIHKKPISLDLEQFYQKIAGNRRGGFCYELNGLFNWLLASLGYKTTLISARVMRQDGSPAPEFDHMAILVMLEKIYLVDVGFGDSLRSPISLDGVVKSDLSGTYRVIRSTEVEDEFYFQKVIQNEWTTEFQFTTIPRQLAEFAEMCLYHQTSPESHFTQKMLATIGTKEGRVTLSGDHIVYTTAEGKEKVSVDSSEMRMKLVKQHFGIDLMDLE